MGAQGVSRKLQGIQRVVLRLDWENGLKLFTAGHRVAGTKGVWLGVDMKGNHGPVVYPPG